MTTPCRRIRFANSSILSTDVRLKSNNEGEVPMASDSHHLEPETEVAGPVSSLLGRLVAGVLGGILLAWIFLGVCALALADPIPDADAEGITLAEGAILIVGIAMFVHSVVFAIGSTCTAKVWRILILRSSAAAFSTPLAVIVAWVRLAVGYEHTSMGPIVYFYAGAFGVAGGVVLRVIGLRIARPAVPTPHAAPSSVPLQET